MTELEALAVRCEAAKAGRNLRLWSWITLAMAVASYVGGADKMWCAMWVLISWINGVGFEIIKALRALAQEESHDE